MQAHEESPKRRSVKPFSKSVIGCVRSVRAKATVDLDAFWKYSFNSNIERNMEPKRSQSEDVSYSACHGHLPRWPNERSLRQFTHMYLQLCSHLPQEQTPKRRTHSPLALHEQGDHSQTPGQKVDPPDGSIVHTIGVLESTIGGSGLGLLVTRPQRTRAGKIAGLPNCKEQAT